MEKVMEGQGILTGHKCMNPANHKYKYCYTSQLKYISWLEDNVSHAIGQNSMAP